jgi:hypothetical protein
MISVMEELWSSDLDMVCIADPTLPEAQNAFKECARRLEVS